jgi:hypothetical protein
MIKMIYVEEIKDKCPPASPELAMAGRPLGHFIML